MTIRFLLRSTCAMLLALGISAPSVPAQDAGEKTDTPAAQNQASEAQPDDAKPDEAKPDAATPDNAKPDEAKPDDAKPDGANPEDAKPEEPLPEDTGTPAEQFTKTLAKWRELEAKVKAARAEFRTTPATDRGAVLTRHNALAEQLNELLPKLREKAVAAYNAAPNEDDEVVRILVGLMANDNRSDRYADARQMGDLLSAHECAENAYQGQMGAALYCMGEFDAAAPYLKVAKGDSKTQTPLVEMVLREVELREAEAEADDLPRVRLTTSKGDVVVELFENQAPNTVANFISLVEKGFYDGTPFHRVLEDFMAQGGDPDGNGTGGPGYSIPCECYEDEHRNHFRGSLAMAHSGRDTGGSQFFITFARTPHLDGLHTVFGRVVEGLEHVDALTRIDPRFPVEGVNPDKLVKAEVIRKREHEYKPRKVGETDTAVMPPKSEPGSDTDAPKSDAGDAPKTGEGDKHEGDGGGEKKPETEAPKDGSPKDDGKSSEPKKSPETDDAK